MSQIKENLLSNKTISKAYSAILETILAFLKITYYIFSETELNALVPFTFKISLEKSNMTTVFVAWGRVASLITLRILSLPFTIVSTLIGSSITSAAVSSSSSPSFSAAVGGFYRNWDKLCYDSKIKNSFFLTCQIFSKDIEPQARPLTST
jgi:hypothetical protein